MQRLRQEVLDSLLHKRGREHVVDGRPALCIDGQQRADEALQLLAARWRHRSVGAADDLRGGGGRGGCVATLLTSSRRSAHTLSTPQPTPNIQPLTSKPSTWHETAGLHPKAQSARRKRSYDRCLRRKLLGAPSSALNLGS
eukprot:168910-Chlamydomonas_euryale.AAC.1